MTSEKFDLPSLFINLFKKTTCPKREENISKQNINSKNEAR